MKPSFLKNVFFYGVIMLGVGVTPTHLFAEKAYKDPTTSMEFVWIPKGCFDMGNGSEFRDEYPTHKVCVDGFCWVSMR